MGLKKIATVIATLFLLQSVIVYIVANAQQQPDYCVDLNCSDNTHSVVAGETTTYKINATNAGRYRDTIELSAYNAPDFLTIYIIPDNVTVQSNESKIVTMIVYAQESAIKGSYDIIVWGQSKNSSAFDVVLITVIVEVAYDFEINTTGDIITVPQGAYTVTTIEVKNTGRNAGVLNFTATTKLIATFTENILCNRKCVGEAVNVKAYVAEYTVSLAPYEVKNISLFIRAPTNISVGIYDVNVTGVFCNQTLTEVIKVRVVFPTDILFVEDDTSTEFKDVLNDTFYNYNAIDAINATFRIMEDYNIVIWNVGTQWNNTLTTLDQKNISEYLDSGGALWLLGQDILYDLGLNDFIMRYLHVKNATLDAGLPGYISGADSDPITDGLICQISELGNLADDILPDDDSFGIFSGMNNYSAIRYSGDYKIVFFAFDITALSESNDRTAITNKVIKWFLEEPLVTITCTNNISTVAPGNQTLYTITASNGYSYQDRINFTIYAPLRWDAYFNRTLVLGVNETKNIDIIIQVPQNAQTGIYQIRIVGRSLYAGNISVDLEVRVAAEISVLLVEDSGNSELRDILNKTILVYDTYLVDENGFGPSSEIMRKYDVVIWNIGNRWNNTLTAQDQENISQYLDSGGALWLLGRDILYDLGLNDFVTQYLHVATADQDIGLPEFMYSVPNNPVIGDISCYIAAEEDDYADALTPDNNATGIFLGNVNYSAISYFKTYKVVFFAFDFLRIVDENNQENVASGVLNWLAHKESLITIETICFSKANPEEDEIIEIYANISNQGNKGSENITVRFIIDNYIVSEINISALQECEWYNTSISWKAVKGMHLVKVEAEHICSTKVLEVAEKKKEIEISLYVICIAVFMCIIAFGAVFLHMWRKRR